jgi:hypothetical protein
LRPESPGAIDPVMKRGAGATIVTWNWLRAPLPRGVWPPASSLKMKIEPDEQNEFKLE